MLQCVIVLYKTEAADSVALQSLRDCLRTLGDGIDLLLYDNSPVSTSFLKEDWQRGNLRYIHDPRNEGLATAYNSALREASKNHHTWLLLFDQDTKVDAGFLNALRDQLASELPGEVCAVVPRLVQGDTFISPTCVQGMREVALEADVSGVYLSRIQALNSGACLRVAAMEAIGGFPAEYPLDYLDHAVFFRLQQAGGRVVVLGCTLQHRLSLLNLQPEMSPTRYRLLLSAERHFIRESASRTSQWIYRARLLKRSWNQARRQRSFQHAWITLQAAIKM